jgi:hypothetical protein
MVGSSEREDAMAIASACSICGAVLPEDAPAGPCDACVAGWGTDVDATADHVGRPEREPTPRPEELAGLIPQIEVIERIGGGGMGVVYRARQVKLDRLVALKLIRPDVAGDPTFAERFGREARALARLNHPNILTVYDFGEAGGLFYLVMELVQGESLRQRLLGGPLEVAEAFDVAAQVCDGLAFAHDRGVVHRDVKPENILLASDGQVKLADFGLAKLVHVEPGADSLTQTHQVLGTPRYMAPEQLESPKDADHRSDLYSLGVVLYEMLVGARPVGHFPLPSAARPGLNELVDRTIQRALRPAPADRYQRAEDLKADLPTVGGVGRAAVVAPDEIESARRQVRGPARGLLCVGLLNFLVALPLLNASLGTYWGLVFPAVLCLYLGVGTIVAALKMKGLESRGYVVFASILAVLPISPIAVLGLPIGAWALFVLSRPEVAAGFRAVRERGPVRAEADEATGRDLRPTSWPTTSGVPQRTAKLKPDPATAVANRRAEVADPDAIEAARRRVRGPARGLVACGLLNLVLLPLWLALAYTMNYAYYRRGTVASPTVGFLLGLAMLVISNGPLGVAMLIAGLRMMELEACRFVRFASVVALLPISPLAPFNMAVAAWALAVLGHRTVVAAFRAVKERAPAAHAAKRPVDSMF